jgi:hypothetical protein
MVWEFAEKNIAISMGKKTGFGTPKCLIYLCHCISVGCATFSQQNQIVQGLNAKRWGPELIAYIA